MYNAVLRSEDTRVGRGLTTAAFVGWALLVGSQGLLWTGMAMPAWSSIRSYVIITALFGLPLSLLFCFTVGLVAWLATVQRRWIRMRDAARVGAIVGLVLYLLWGALTFLSIVGSQTNAKPELHDLPQAVLFIVGAAAYAVAVGAISGLAAWWAGGRKTTLCDTEADA